jgi:murein DD-endopeptidase MepM/ murein hydrolase activator NlpD
MTRKLLYAMLVAALAAVAVVAFALPASAEQRTFKVQLAGGAIITVTVDAACVPMDQVPGLPGTPIEDLTPPDVCAGNGGGGGQTPPPTATTPTPPAQQPGGTKDPGPNANGGDNGGTTGSSGAHPSTGHGHRQSHSGSRRPADRSSSSTNSQGQGEGSTKKHKKKSPRRSDGVPTPSNPTFFDALPGPSTGVPNFVIQKFKVPIFLLPIYQAAGIQYGVRWEVLAAINEIETDYGRNLNVSSAGAVGWMQFMPATWKLYGVDANKDGKRDPYNPVDAVFAAARYLKAAGAEKNVRRAVFAYNHAGWYVDSVMLRARLIAGYPPDFVGSLTGLTEGRFPVAARAKYADDAAEQATKARVKAGQNAAKVIESSPTRRGIDIYTREGAAVVATNDGVVRKIGYSASTGKYIVLQDVYGNQYTYSQLGSVQRMYPVPNADASPDKQAARAISARAQSIAADPKPTLPASAGTHSVSSSAAPKAAAPKKQRAPAKPATRPAPAQAPVTYKARLFAHPQRPQARQSGGLDQVFQRQTNGKTYTTYDNFFAGKVGLNAKNAKLRPLKKGSKVVAGTVLARVGKTDVKKAPHIYFEIRPAGKGAPKIDPKPILDGWKLLESTAVYRASGKNALYGESSSFSIGQVLLLPKPLLIKRVLSDPRIEIYPGGRNDVRTGQIDRRVLATLEYLSESGLEPSVSSLKGNHGLMTASGNVSEHSSGNAVDIAKINGVPILGHQDPGGVAEQTVRRLMLLQGTMAPHQIISLLDLGANTMALPDHNDHIHVGFHPLYGDNAKLGAQTAAILKPGQWDNLLQRLNTLPNPVVPTKPSKYALPAKGAGQGAAKHIGD